MLRYKFNNEPAPTTINPDASDKNDDDVPDMVRPGQGKIKRSELSRIMRAIITDAQQLAVDELADARTTATSYYNGDPFGTEEDGRSQVVITEVRDQHLGVKPSLMRIFFAPDSTVEFMPTNEAGADGAKQATDYVNFVFQHQNSGWRVVNDILDDGLIRRLGVVKWGWEDGESEEHVDEGLTLDEVYELSSRDDIEIIELEEDKADGEQLKGQTYTITYSVQLPGHITIYSIPPEEFIFDRQATSIEDAVLVGHARLVPNGDLVAMGIEQDIIEKHGGTQSALEFSSDKTQRNEKTTVQVGELNDAGDANKMTLYCECYVMVDANGDGKRELRNVCTIGPGFHIVTDTPAREKPFALFAPIPEAHAMIGFGLADLTMDIQYTKSHIARSMLDSFALSVFPRMAFVESMASVEDILNTEIGAPIRTKDKDAVQSFTHPFTGQNALPLLEYFDQIAENRTGRDKGAMSLDADSLQSSTAGAVQAALSAAQERTEFLARQFAEQLLKPMFYGIYRLLVEHKNELQPQMMKLRGDFVPIDIATWDADYSVIVNVALGTSLPEQKIERLLTFAGKQEQIIQLAGDDNPLSSIPEYRHTLSRILELSGERDISNYLKPVPKNYVSPPQPPPPPSPETVIAQAQMEVERLKAQKDVAIKQAELQLKQADQEFNHNFKIVQLAQQSALRRYAIDAQYKSVHPEKMLELDAASDETAVRTAMDAQKMQNAKETAAGQAQMADAQRQHDAQQAQLDRQQEASQNAQQQAHEQDMQANAPQPAAPAGE